MASLSFVIKNPGSHFKSSFQMCELTPCSRNENLFFDAIIINDNFLEWKKSRTHKNLTKAGQNVVRNLL